MLGHSDGGDASLVRRLAKRQAARKRSHILREVYGRGRRRTITDPDVLLYRPRADLLRDTLSPNFTKNYRSIIKRIKDRSTASIDLREFSFSRNPKGTLEKIREVARKSAVCTDIRLNFRDDKCDDVAPYMVLAHLLKSLPPVFSGGVINREVTAVVQSVGLDRALGIGRILGHRDSDDEILPFKMVRRAPPGYFGDKDHQLRPQYKELVADRFCQALEDWLAASGYELTDNGSLLIVSSITEALDNAERHGHPAIDDGMGDWTMAGFSRLKGDEGAERFDCSVSIVSVGSTISQSLVTAGPQVAKRIDSYVASQGPLRDERRDLLRTVMALQDGITRVSEASAARRGGVGLLTLVDFFAELGETDKRELDSVFTIISGTSCLRMTYPYRRGTVSESSGLRELWLNSENDANVSPDANHAFSLEDRFAGTILSACFSIDRDFLKRKFAGDDDG